MHSVLFGEFGAFDFGFGLFGECGGDGARIVAGMVGVGVGVGGVWVLVGRRDQGCVLDLGARRVLGLVVRSG